MSVGAGVSVTAVLAAWMFEAAPGDGPTATDANTVVAEPGLVTPIEAIVVRVRGIDEGVLREALAPRLVDVAIHAFPERPDAGTSFAFVDVVAATDRSAAEITIILPDGRAFVRSVPAVTADLEGARALAPTIVNTLAAIEEQRLEPVAHEMPMPDVPQIEPTPVASPQPPDRVASDPVPSAPTPPPPSLELMLEPQAGASFGLGAPVAGFSGWGGGLRLGLKTRRNALAIVGFAARGWARDGVRLVRLRVMAGGGYVVRRRAFEMPVWVGATVEPWLLSESGSVVEPEPLDEANAELLIGGLVGVAPGFRVAPTDSFALRVGGFVELGGSVLTSGAAARVTRQSGTDPASTVMTFGGLELSVGASLGLWFSLPD